MRNSKRTDLEVYRDALVVIAKGLCFDSTDCAWRTIKKIDPKLYTLMDSTHYKRWSVRKDGSVRFMGNALNDLFPTEEVPQP